MFFIKVYISGMGFYPAFVMCIVLSDAQAGSGEKWRKWRNYLTFLLRDCTNRNLKMHKIFLYAPRFPITFY